MTQRKPLSPRALSFIFAAGALAFVGAVELWSSTIPEGADPSLGLTIFIVAGLAIAFPATIAFMLKYWRRLDEAAREAHKWAWFWGGSLGIAPGFLAATWPHQNMRLAAELGFAQPEELIKFGAHAVLASMMLGYAIAWGVWWFRKR